MVITKNFSSSSPKLKQLVIRFSSTMKMAALFIFQSKFNVVQLKLFDCIGDALRVFRNALLVLFLRVKVITTIKGFTRIGFTLILCHHITSIPNAHAQDRQTDDDPKRKASLCGNNIHDDNHRKHHFLPPSFTVILTEAFTLEVLVYRAAMSGCSAFRALLSMVLRVVGAT
nr:MAG TPA: hypothetical protein [Caudoviricetes sp.]